MPKANAIGKNLQLCFTKIKCPEEPGSSISTRISSDGHNHPVVIKSYNSLYDHNCRVARSSSSISASSSSSSFSTTSSDDGGEPDFTTAFASHRFFFSSPGLSNSIIESTPSSAATSSKSSDALGMSVNDSAVASTRVNNSLLVDSCESQSPKSQNSDQTAKNSRTIAFPTYSQDPYQDFRRSMQEMVEARDLHDVKTHWDYLHELLLCYLALNPKSNHKFIVRAYADLLVSLLASQPENDGHRESGREFSRRNM